MTGFAAPHPTPPRGLSGTLDTSLRWYDGVCSLRRSAGAALPHVLGG